MKQKKSIFLFLSTAGMILSSCSANSQNGNIKKDTTTLIVNVEENKSSLKINETVQLSAHVYGSIKDEVEFLSLNEEILTVDENGLVKAIKEGNGKIQISAKEDASTKKILSFEVYATMEDKFESVRLMMDDFKSYDYKKGVIYPCNINLDLGKVKGSLSGSSEIELFDTSRNSTYSTLKLPVELTIVKENEDADFMKARFDTNTFFNDLFSRNILLSTANKTLKIKENLLLSLVGKLDDSYLDYLSLNDFSSLTDICFYASQKSDFYTSLDMNFSDDETNSLHPFAFEEFDLVSLLLPFYKKISSALSSEKESIDVSSYLSDDGLLKLQNMLCSYLVEEKTENGYTLSINDTILKFINSYYKEKVTNYTYHISSSSFDVSFQLPTSITKIYLNMEMDTSSSHPVSNLSFIVEGTREESNETYDVLSFSLNRTDIKNDLTGLMKKEEFENLKKAKQDFTFNNETTSIVKLIKESDVLYQAETTYGADTDNKNLQKKKSSLLSFYYQSFHDVEFTRLLYPMYRRLSSLNYTYQDETFTFLSSDTIKDNEIIQSEVEHLVNGEKKEDFTYSLKASNEEMFSIVDETKIKAIHALYDGGVNDRNEKTYSNESQIEFTIKPKDDSSLKEQTKKVTLKYTGDKVGMPSSAISFKQNEDFDASNREYLVNEHTTIDLKDILSLENNDYLTLASSTDTTLAKTKILTPNKVDVLSITEKNGHTRDLVGIKFTITSLSTKTTKNSFIYLRIKKAS